MLRVIQKDETETVAELERECLGKAIEIKNLNERYDLLWEECSKLSERVEELEAEKKAAS